MNGSRLFLDTNIIVYLLSGDNTLAEFIHKKTVYVSFVTQLELMSYPDITEEEELRINDFLLECVVIDINPLMKLNVVELRKKYRLKLPDSIIMASAMHLDLPIVTSDKGFSKVEELETVVYENV